MKKETPEKILSEFIDYWNSIGLTGKVLLVIACVGASTTLTSLSGIIIEWRGQIADMLSFYSQHIRGPIVTFIRYVTFDILQPSGEAIDAMLLYLIYFSSEKRSIGRLSETSAVNYSFFIMFVIMLPIVLLAILLFALYLVDKYLMGGVWSYAGTIIITIPLMWIFLSLYAGVRHLSQVSKGNYDSYFDPESRQPYFRLEVRRFIKFATPILFAFLVLLVLTSINLGFSETNT